jgi:hypothetical protein
MSVSAQSWSIHPASYKMPQHLNHHPINSGRPGFSSFKCASPIVYPRRCCRDFLVLATLDPATQRIEEAQLDRRSLPEDCFFSIIVERSDRRTLILLCDRSDGPLLVGSCPALALSRPRLNDTTFDTARLIWSRRKLQIHPGFALQVQHRLSASDKPLCLADLLDTPGVMGIDATDAIMAMATRGLANIHIAGELRPTTLVTAPNSRFRMPARIACDAGKYRPDA